MLLICANTEMKNRKYFKSVVLALGLAITASAGSQAALAKVKSPTTITGKFSIIWGDKLAGSNEVLRYTLTDDAGQVTALALDESLAHSLGGVLSLNRKDVTAEGALTASLSVQSAATVLNVTAISFPEPQAAISRSGTEEAYAAVSGSRPWVSIMCKFSDHNNEPKDLVFFQEMYASFKPGLNHYWLEQSFDAVDVAASGAFGWFTLPHTESYYNPTDTGQGTNLNLLRTDCIAAADASVDYSTYSGINMMFNTDFDNGWAWGGSAYMNLDGTRKSWSVTWEPPWSYADITVIAHEMGHGFGLPHSSGAYGKTYDNIWDVMSDTWRNCGNSTDTTYGCLGQHTISFHKDSLGWIPANQKYTANGVAMISLDHLSLLSTTNYRMAQIPIAESSTHFYTVEVRQLSGYDIKLPAKAIIIHEVDTTRSRPARVVDIDYNGDTGDAGAMWLVGETFTDAANGISVSVVSSSPTGFDVSISVPLQQPSPAVSNPEPANDATVSIGISGQRLRVFAPGATSGSVYYDDDFDVSYSVAASIIGDNLQVIVPYASGRMNNDGTNYWYVEATNAAGTTRYPTSGNLSFTVTPASRPDLVVNSTSVSETVLTRGQDFSVDVTAYNQGAAMADSTTLRYYRSADATISSTDTQVMTGAIASLVAGESSPENALVTAPQVDGTYWFGACIDEVVSESNISNQCSSGVQIEVSASPQDDDILLLLVPAIISARKKLDSTP